MTIDLRPFAELNSDEPEEKNVIDLKAFRTRPRDLETKRPEEETKKKRSLGRYLYDIMGEGLAIQAKIIPGPDVAPQFLAGQLQEVTGGGVNILPPQTPGGKFARETGKTTALVSGLGLLGKLFKPLGFLQKTLGIASFGGARNAANQYFEKGEVDLKEVGVQTALFGALELGSEAVSTVLNTRKAINFISESTGQTKPTVAKFLAETALDNIKRKFGFKPTEGTINALAELNPEAVAEAWEEAINAAKETVEEGESLSTELASDLVKKEADALAPTQPVIDLAPFAKEVAPVIEPPVEPKAPPVINLRPVAKETVADRERLSQEVEQLKNQIEQIPGKTQEAIKERSPLIQELNKKELELSKLKKEPTAKPIEAFHGTQTEFKEFGKSNDLGPHFTISKGTAKEFALETEQKGRPGRIIQAQLNIKNPLELPDLGGFDPLVVAREIDKKGLSTFKGTDTELGELEGKVFEVIKGLEPGSDKSLNAGNKIVREHLQKKGFDAVKYINRVEGKPVDTFIVFDPKDIKQIGETRFDVAGKEIAPQPPKKQLPAKILPRAVVKKEPPKQPPPPTPPPPSKPPPPEQPSGEDPGSPEKINSETARFFSKAAAKLNVEFPFKKIGAPETGFAVKNYYDQINKFIDQGKFVVKQIKKVGLTKDQLNNAVIQAESAIPPKDSKEREVWGMLRSYFDASLQDLKKYGVITKGFHERIASNILADIQALNEIIKISRGDTKLKYQKQAQDLLSQLKDVADLRFVSIPVRHLFDSKMKSDPALTKKAVKFLNKKKRKTLRLQDLVDSGLVDKKDLTPKLVVNSYARKFGRDIALAKIINAAKKEGLATKEFKEGAVKIPGYLAPELAKYWINPVFADFIEGYTNPRTFSLWEKTSNRLKGWSFYNPAVLSANDMWQQAWVVLGQPQAVHKLPGAWGKALKDITKKTANFWEAYDNGLFSSPFVELEKTIDGFTKLVKTEGPSPVLDFLKSMLKLPVKMHEKIYDVMQMVAWTGDKTIRMATYNWLRSQGLSPRESAQTAALYHGDYSRVPPKTRRLLNRFLNTPTFKLVMGATIKENIKNSGKLVASIFKGEKVDPDVRIRAGGLLGMGVILGAMHMIMRSMKYETKTPGLRYKKDIIDKEGNEKTVNINFSLPSTIFWKFAVRGFEAATKPGVENRILKFAKSMKFELSQPIQILWELGENRRRNWDQIYDPRAPTHKQLASVLKYIFVRSVPMVGIPAGESFRDPEETEKLKKEIGFLPTVLPFMFPFLSDREEDVNRKKAMFLVRKMKSLLRRDKLSESEQENYLKEIDRLFGN